MRKVNFAAYVKETTPHVDAAIWLLRANYSNNNESYAVRICWTDLHICGIMICTYDGDSMPVKSRSKPPKLQALREEGTLNPSPDEVHDPKFQDNEFFDPHDIV